MDSIDEKDGLSHEADPELVRILEEMLNNDETITARAVARKHPAIKHASSITRIPLRSNLLTRYQDRQNQFREWQRRTPKRSRDQLAAQLGQRDSRIAELEHQVEVLRHFLLAMIRAVGELGGTSKWLQLYANFREVRNELNKLGVWPQAEVKQILPTLKDN